MEITSAIVLYSVMAIVGFFVAFKSYGSYRLTKDKSLLYLAWTFVFFPLYLVFFTAILLGYQAGYSHELLAATSVFSRLFVFLGIISVLQTKIFQDSILFAKYNKQVILLILLMAFISSVMQLANLQEPYMSYAGILVQRVDLIPGIMIAIVSFFTALYWWYLLIKRLPDNASSLFKFKVMCFGLGALFLALGDSMYVFGAYIPYNIFGSVINLFGYVFFGAALLMPSIRKAMGLTNS